MKWTGFAAGALYSLVVSIEATDWPVVIGPVGWTNKVELPDKADEIWLGRGGSGIVVEPKRLDDGRYWFVSPSLANGPSVVASRVRVGGRWQQIRETFIEDREMEFVMHRPTGRGWFGVVKAGEPARIKLPEFRGERCRIEVVANRIGSQLDPVLTVFDHSNKEIARVDDSRGAGRDPRTVIRPWGKGNYTLEVKDIGNAGGPEFFFWLRTRIDIYIDGHGWFMNWLTEPEMISTSSKLDAPDIAEKATQLELPIDRIERFDRAKDIDWFGFSARAGDKIIAAVQTREGGGVCDAALGLYSEKGTVIAESVGLEANGPSLTNKVEKSGTYRIKVRELNGLFGPDAFYRVVVRMAEPGVTLTTEAERVEITKEGEAKVKIACKRYDYDGPVKLRVDGLPEGVEIVDGAIVEKKNEGELKLKCPKEVEAFNIRIYGSMATDSSEKETKGTKPEEFPVSTMPALKKLFPMQIFPCAAMDGWIAVNPPNK